jgi:hypothetical protein
VLFAVTAAGAQQPILRGDTRIPATAATVTRDGNTIQLRGHVEVRRGTSVVRADEADLPARVELDSEQPKISFQGHVEMRFDDVVPLSVIQR